MSYWKTTRSNNKNLVNYGLSVATNSSDNVGTEFYELELGLVLDIVLDENHPIFKNKEKIDVTIDPERSPADVSGNPPKKTDIDYSWIGRALVRPLISEKTTSKDQLPWAYPLESNFSEYPLINETVILVSQGDKLYYTKKVNYRNIPNNNLNFAIESSTSGNVNTQLFTNSEFIGKNDSLTNYKGNPGYKGIAGTYFTANNNIRTIKRYEGDLLIESRFGQSIHMTAYDDNRNNDIGDSSYSHYKDSGNPMIIIRNRQRPTLKENQSLTLTNSPNSGKIIGTLLEKNVGGYIKENINHDGSSIYITSGQTISEWVTTCYKKMWGTGEEVGAFNGKTNFKYPVLNGDQIIINSDRLILSSRYAETFHYSKKRYGIVTDSEYTLDAHDQIVLTTHVKTVINSPAIYLGEYDQAREPALLGQTTVSWLYELCNWLLEHTHWYKHSHEDAGKEDPSQTQIPVERQRLIALRDGLHNLLSRRVFLTGGGNAPGQNGAII